MFSFTFDLYNGYAIRAWIGLCVYIIEFEWICVWKSSNGYMIILFNRYLLLKIVYLFVVCLSTPMYFISSSQYRFPIRFEQRVFSILCLLIFRFRNNRTRASNDCFAVLLTRFWKDDFVLVENFEEIASPFHNE